MVKVLAIGDPHFKVSAVREAQEFTGKIGKLVREEKPDLIVVLGDIANDFERTHSLAMREICAFFDMLVNSTSHSKLYYIVGNHDYINNNGFLTDDHSLNPFKEWVGMKIVDRPIIEHNFTFCPYVPPGRFGEALGHAPGWERTMAIFAHQEFLGVQLGPIKSTAGDQWPSNMPLVVSGHIHEHQWLQGNVLYVGSPYQTTFGEEDNKTVSILEFSTELGLINERRIDLGMPRKLTLTMTVEQAGELDVPENASVRVYLTGTTEELIAFKKTKKFKELSLKAKVIPKASDTLVVRRNVNARDYMELLKESIEAESKPVQQAFHEALSETSSK